MTQDKPEPSALDVVELLRRKSSGSRPPVTLYLAGDPSTQLEQVIVGRDTYTPTAEGLAVQVAGSAAMTYVGFPARRVFLDALTAGEARTLTLVYAHGLRSGRTEIYPTGQGPGIGVELFSRDSLARE